MAGRRRRLSPLPRCNCCRRLRSSTTDCLYKQADDDAVLSQCFEGLKAYKDGEGYIRLFRPDMNMQRFLLSAQRLCLPVSRPPWRRVGVFSKGALELHQGAPQSRRRLDSGGQRILALPAATPNWHTSTQLRTTTISGRTAWALQDRRRPRWWSLHRLSARTTHGSGLQQCRCLPRRAGYARGPVAPDATRSAGTMC